MENESVKIEVEAKAIPLPPHLGSIDTVIITQDFGCEEFYVNDSDGTLTSFGTYPDLSLPEPPLLSFRLQNLKPDLVSQQLYNRLHDPVLSQLVSDQIVSEVQQKEGPLLIMVSIKLTRKLFTVVPSGSDKGSSREVDSETCVICLEDLSESGFDTKPICELPKCTHLFHEECFVRWLDRGHNSCPLCRLAVCEE